MNIELDHCPDCKAHTQIVVALAVIRTKLLILPFIGAVGGGVVTAVLIRLFGG